MRIHLKRALVALTLVGVAGSAHAVSSYRTQFDSTYGTAGTRLSSCNLCHPGGNTGSFTSYANDFRNNNHSFTAIESRDSDGDGSTNIVEIRALTFPGDANDRPATTSTCTSFTYSAWSACSSSGTQTRTVTSSSPAGCTGGTPVLSQACTPPPTATTCTSFTYSAWGACQSNNTQTRTVMSSSPAGCTGGTPVLSQACTYTPPTQTCGTCHGIPPSSGQHSRHSGRSCSTCHGTGYSSTSVTAPTHMDGVKNVASNIGWNATQRTCSNSCHGTQSWGGSSTPLPTTCSSFTYSAWGACQPTGTQTRTVVSSSPSGCTGGTRVLTQACTYVPPTPAVTCADADADGFAVCDGTCEPAAGDTCGDCNDSDTTVNPGAVESGAALCSDGIDNDCDRIVDAAETACVPPPSTTGDWDISGFRATGSVEVGSRISLSVTVTRTSGSATLTVYGTQNGNRIPVATRTLSSAGTSYFSYVPTSRGTITWVAEITDADPDADRVTRSTWVFGASSSDGDHVGESDD